MVNKNIEGVYELKYSGNLKDSENLYVHFGYANWCDVSEKKLRKLKNCYKTEITIPQDSELNFCFRDDYGNWDNNYGCNYYFVPGSKDNYDFIELNEKESKLTTSNGTKTTKTAKTSKTCKTAKSIASGEAQKSSKSSTKAKTTTKKVSKKEN